MTGEVVPNRVIVPLGADGALDVFSRMTSDVIADISGYYMASAGATYTPLSGPVRICDTRAGNPSRLSGAATQCNGETIGAGATLTVNVGGFGAPSTASAVVLNVTAVNPSFTTYLTVFPGGTRPVASDLNPVADQTEPNLVVATVGSNGTIQIYNHAGNSDVLVDLEGWYQ
jgi:hypothetical protein